MVEHWIADAAAGSRYFTADDVWRALEAAEAQLWLCWQDKPLAVAVTQLETTSRGKHCRIWIMTGELREEWQDLLPELEQWARREGCNLMRHEARPGWSRVLKRRGYDMPHVILEKELH